MRVEEIVALEELEIDLLLEAIYRQHGFDFRGYARSSLRQARNGIFPMEVMKKYTANYCGSGGTGALSDYYTSAYDHVVLRQSLRDHVVFAQHNLATDGAFNEFNVILCRNVMIYFTPPLQERVHDLFARSFATFGLLGIGSHESLPMQTAGPEYEPLVAREKLFRRAH